MSTVITGSLGFVVDQECVRDWTISETVDLVDYACSMFPGAMSRQDGNKDWTGNFATYNSNPSMFPGDYFQFQGIIQGPAGAATKGVDSQANGAICDSTEIELDIEGGAPIVTTVSMAGNDELQYGTVDSSGHSETPVIQESSSGKRLSFFDLDDDGAGPRTTIYNALDLRTATLTFSAENPDFVSTTKPGITQRASGNVDAALSFSVFTNDFDNLPRVNEVLRVYFHVSPTTFWDVAWMKVSEVTDLTVDIEGNEIVGATVNMVLVASEEQFPSTVPAVKQGWIVDPATTVRWGNVAPTTPTNPPT